MSSETRDPRQVTDANTDRFSGFAGLYDRYRPAPPDALAAVLCGYVKVERPGLVVDLGCGTGLSTRYWAGRAESVIGLDPTADMLAQAMAQLREEPHPAGIEFRAGTANATGLPDGCADIVTVSQALHWMDPFPTFQEARRILRVGGVFAAFDNDWPPSVLDAVCESAYSETMQRVYATEVEMGIEVFQWPKSGHLGRMQESGCFRSTRELALHHVDVGNAERFAAILLSQGGTAGLLRRGVSEAKLGIDTFRALCKDRLGDQPRPWYWTSRLRLGFI
jgi:ubiquinone/menaquinone biosynthesis C-methylase UbiE